MRGFSKETIKAYIFHNQKFVEFIKKDFNQVKEEDIKFYLSELISTGISPATIALKKASLKFMYDEILKKNIVSFKTPKIPKKIPEILTKEEVSILIKSACSKKSKLIIELLYSSGLRLSECLNLKINDLELDQKIGWVRKGKGSKDRIIILSDRVVKHINKYLKTLDEAEIYLFPGVKGKTLTHRNIQKLVKRAAKKAKITKKITPHSLRHAFATHLLDNNVNIRYIQELLGHANLQTTQIYTAVSKEQLKKIKSPLDNL